MLWRQLFPANKLRSCLHTAEWILEWISQNIKCFLQDARVALCLLDKQATVNEHVGVELKSGLCFLKFVSLFMFVWVLTSFPFLLLFSESSAAPGITSTSTCSPPSSWELALFSLKTLCCLLMRPWTTAPCPRWVLWLVNNVSIIKQIATSAVDDDWVNNGHRQERGVKEGKTRGKLMNSICHLSAKPPR